MANLWIIYIVLLILRDSMLAYSHDIQNGKSKDDLFELRDGGIVKGRGHEIARLHGDLRLGAMVPIHTSSAGLCSGLYVDGIMLVEAIIFALQEVKNRKLLPEGITLGYEIRDTCNSVTVAQRHTLDIVNEVTKFERNNVYINDSNGSLLSYSTRDYMQSRNSVIAVVGAGNSEISVAVNRLLSAFSIPQIGFASTSRFLSEKLRFPSFFRTVPSDAYQVQGFIALFQKFSWNYVGVLVSDGVYGRPLAESFKSFAKAKGICITYEHLVPFQVNMDYAKSIIRELNLKTKISIIVILLPEPDVETMLVAMLEIGLKNRTLIASDSWSKAIKDLKFSSIVAGTLGYAHHYSQLKEFEDHFLSLKPNKNTWNPWFNETWEHLFDCKLPRRYHESTNKTLAKSKKAKLLCDLEKQYLKKEHFTRFHYVSNVINAVFAVAYGIQKSCERERIAVSSLTSRELLKTLKGMTFKKYDGKNITFDENGDISGKYNLVNIRPDLTSTNVGIWDGNYLELDNFKTIWWNDGQKNPPRGVCSVLCPTGSYKLASKEDPKCCWTCQRCHAGTISDRPGATKCISCAKNYTTNSNQTACVFIPLNYLDWHSFWTISIVIMAFISMSLLMFVVILFMCYVNTPVVKSSNRELSFLLVVGLFFTFLVPFVFAGKPTKLKCIISQVMFCVGCALALSAMLFRTLRIVLLFEFTNQRRWLLNNKYQIAMTIALTFAELTYCLLWVAVNAPGVKTVIIRPTKRYLVCKFDKYWYGGSYILLIALSVMCTALAVKGRKLPKNFNEVRHIGFSMFTFNIVWVVFMCAQYGASLEYDVKINCFAMIISSLMILVLLFGPKVFVLLFRAHLNKKELFEEEVRRYSFGVPNGNLSTNSLSATSLRRGSSMTFRTANPSSDQFLTVGSNDMKRKRSHSFDAMASRLYQNNRLLKRCSKATQTDFLSDNKNASKLRRNSEVSPIVVKITEEQEGKYSFPKKNILSLNGISYEQKSISDTKNNDSSNDVDLGVCTDAQRKCGLPELDKLMEFSLDSDTTAKSKNPESLQKLNDLFDDLDILGKDIPNGNPNSFRQSNGRHAFSSTTPNATRECNGHKVSAKNERKSGYSFAGAVRPELTQNDFLEIDLDWDYDDENFNWSDNRNGYDRETVL